MVLDQNGYLGIGNNAPNAPLSFPPVLGKKITLYPGATGDVGFGVSGNRLQIYSDNPNADVAIGYDAAGTFNENFAVKANGALAVSENTGAPGQVLTSKGNGAAATWMYPIAHNAFASNTFPDIFTFSTIILSNLSRTINIPAGQNARLFLSMSANYVGSGCVGLGCTAKANLDVLVDGGLATTVLIDVSDNINSFVSVSNFPVNVTSGLHLIEYRIVPNVNALTGLTITPKYSTIIAVPQ
jgi:hypothetical protein